MFIHVHYVEGGETWLNVDQIESITPAVGGTFIQTVGGSRILVTDPVSQLIDDLGGK